MAAAHKLFASAHSGAQRRPPRRLQVSCWACGNDHSSCGTFALCLPVPRMARHVRLLHLWMGILHSAASRVWRWQSAEAPIRSSCEQRDTQLIIGRDFCTITDETSAPSATLAGRPADLFGLHSFCIPLSTAPHCSLCRLLRQSPWRLFRSVTVFLPFIRFVMQLCLRCKSEPDTATHVAESTSVAGRAGALSSCSRRRLGAGRAPLPL